MRYWENIIRHVATTLIGLVVIVCGLGSAVWMLVEHQLTWYGIVITVVCLIAGARLLGAESLASEYAQLSAFIKNPFRK